MPDALFFAGSVLVPLVFGLIPAFLPVGAPQVVRWLAWLAALALTVWYGAAMRDAPDAFRLVAWGTIAASATLSLIVLVAETGQRPRVRP